jgi:starch phosphorylase
MTSPVSAQAVAYFSMEVGLESDLPTYSGGLGVLAGDTLRAAADLGVPMVGVSLAHRNGYFHQHLDARGNQSESPAPWSPESRLEQSPVRIAVTIEGRPVRARAWRYPVHGLNGHVVPVYLLDTDLPENAPNDRRLTDTLYGGDARYRLCQEVVLGVGGVELLQALGHQVATYHMNEGHSALLVLGLLAQLVGDPSVGRVTAETRDAVRRRCVFTTHTPVPAGQDQFPAELVRSVLGGTAAEALLG